MPCLITGFEPFNNEILNPSAVIAKAVARKIGVEPLILPVSYERSFEVLKPYLDSGKYRGMILLGQAGGRQKVGLERVALNLEDSESMDADQVTRIEMQIDSHGPHAILNPLPLREIVGKLSSKIGPVEISSSAGTYVCNSLYYKVFRWQQENPGKLGWQIFIHLPYMPEQMIGKPDHTAFLAQSVMEHSVIEVFKELMSFGK